MPPLHTKFNRKKVSASVASIEKRIVTPVVLQMHATECGAACMGIVLGYFGCWVSLTELREVCEVSRDGSSAASLLRAARKYGLECKGLGLHIDQLTKIKPPMIIFWQFSHFVVLEGFEGDKVYLNDPASGHRKLSLEDFSQSYSGIALTFQLGKNFKISERRISLIRQIQDLLPNFHRILTLIVTCGLLLTLLTLLIPFSLRSIVDELLVGYSGIDIIVSLLVFAGLLVYVLTYLKNTLLERLAVRTSIVSYEQSVSKLLSLPIEFFSHRLVGDITDRVASNDRIGNHLADQFLAQIIEVLMVVLLFCAMIIIDYRLALIVGFLSLLQGFLSNLLKTRIAVENGTLRREQGMLLSIGMQIHTIAESLRITGAEDRYFANWSGQQAYELNVRQRFAELKNLNAALPIFITTLRTAAILGIGGTFVLSGQISLGMLIAFYFLAEIFMMPMSKFFEFAEKRVELITDLQRSEDISKTNQDQVFLRRQTTSNKTIMHNGRLQIAGHLELKNITFGYNRSRPPLIKDFNLTIKPGQRVAIVGPSGSGKSTISRLVAGIFQPWEGAILFDGQPRKDIPEEVMRRSISMVDQEVVLFPTSVRDNITLWNNEIPDEAVYAAAKDAQIHDEILVREHGYATIVEEGGRNFSGGQQQRMEIARALVGNPVLMILDEATSSLDASTEEKFDKAIRRRGISCLIVAHRLSTIRDCDLIVVFKNGVEVQRGSHEELIADDTSVYAHLVKMA